MIIDFHAHLLSSSVKFDRIYDKVLIKLFASKLGIEAKELLLDPYKAYTNSIINNIKNSKYLTKSVLFGVDAKLDYKGKFIERDLTVCATNGDLLKIYQENSDLIIPFFSINPLRVDALDEIERCVSLGFKGAKFLQNYWGVNLNDKKFIPYYEKLKEHNLPLIIHIGSESSISSYREFEGIDMLKLPLKIGIKVVAAHMALSYSPKSILKALSLDPKNFNKEYFKLIKMLNLYPNLYADISAILTPVRAKVLNDLSQRVDIHHKLLFATDFPVPFTTILNSYDLSLKKRYKIAKITNPYDRYIETIFQYFKKDNPLFSNYNKLITV